MGSSKMTSFDYMIGKKNNDSTWTEKQKCDHDDLHIRRAYHKKKDYEAQFSDDLMLNNEIEKELKGDKKI